MPQATATRPRRRQFVLGGIVVIALGALAAAALALLPIGGGQHATTAGRVSWRPPALHHAQTVTVTPDHRALTLDPGRDYVVQMPHSPVRGGVSIAGGHNVVLIGGEIDIPPQGRRASIDSRRGLLLKAQT